MSRPLVIVAVLAMLASGCISVYRPDQQQGNVVTADMAEKLKPGMTRSQVRFVLGTPLVADPFHPDRWDYWFALKRGKDGSRETRRLTVFFENDALARVEGDRMPPAPDMAAPAGATPGSP